jgi:hypothetical protein
MVKGPVRWILPANGKRKRPRASPCEAFFLRLELDSKQVVARARWPTWVVPEVVLDGVHAGLARVVGGIGTS